MSRLATTGLILFVFILGAAIAPAAQAKKIAAYPSPGVKIASNETTISFRGVKPKALGRVTVVGSRTGRHAGRIRAHFDSKGATFNPRRNFAFKERVTVTVPRHTFFGVKRGKHSYSFVTGELVEKGWRDEPQVPPVNESPTSVCRVSAASPCSPGGVAPRSESTSRATTQSPGPTTR